jgi:hypothetical protein
MTTMRCPSCGEPLSETRDRLVADSGAIPRPGEKLLFCDNRGCSAYVDTFTVSEVENQIEANGLAEQARTIGGESPSYRAAMNDAGRIS